MFCDLTCDWSLDWRSWSLGCGVLTPIFCDCNVGHPPPPGYIDGRLTSVLLIVFCDGL